MRNRVFPLLVAALLTATAGTAGAGEVGVEIVFSDQEAAIIRAYYREHAQPSPHKRRGVKSLPPGIAKNLQRGKPLPPGIAKQVLPHDLILLLPPPPVGFERIAVAGKILLIETATQVIHDVLEDVILG